MCTDVVGRTSNRTKTPALSKGEGLFGQDGRPDASKRAERRVSDSSFSAGANHDTVEFVDLDLSDQNAGGSRFLECRIANCTLDDAVLDNCRFIDTGVESVNATTLNLRGSVWRDCRVDGGRVGALVAHGANMTRVEFVASKLDYVNLRGCELSEVSFINCTVGELDLTGSNAKIARFDGTSIETLRLADNTFEKVDLSKAVLHKIEGIAGLRGATISQQQSHELAPALAEHIGVDVLPAD